MLIAFYHPVDYFKQHFVLMKRREEEEKGKQEELQREGFQRDLMIAMNIAIALSY